MAAIAFGLAGLLLNREFQDLSIEKEEVRLVPVQPVPLLPGGFSKVQDRPCCFCGRLAYVEHATQKEFEPPFPVVVISDSSEPVIVLGAMGFQVVAQVQERTFQDLPLAQQERDQQPPNTAVAVEEGMDRLELGMGQSALYQRG